MKKLLLALVLGVLLLAALAGGAAALAVALIGPWVNDGVLQGYTITINGNPLSLPDLSQLSQMQVAVGTAVLVLVMLLVVPLSLVIALGCTLLGLLAGAMAMVLGLALALSPLLLPAALVWWLLRSRSAPTAAPAPAARHDPPV
jgi:hypothetical protein